ncbi:hypothetical protein OUZ56_026299 [Daphnia magna]|uniref:Uncharacterized protein n=1 Tax=Daphnia magna TaxID=35525 RepID=A0ABQ9ZLB7_9CRUS|nr:hypothetical protein OUZ56_026299 [Daphnia magna]
MASPQAPPTPISKLSDMTPKLCVQNDPTRRVFISAVIEKGVKTSFELRYFNINNEEEHDDDDKE